MKEILRIALVLSVVGVAYFAYRTFFTSGTIGPTTNPTQLACSVVADIDFALATDIRGATGSKEKDILAVTPTAQPKTKILKLQHASELMTSASALCKGSTTAPSTCAQINAFTWGYDWIPLKSRSPGDPYCLAPLNGKGRDDEGWAILYFTRGNKIFALGWGSELDLHWPQSSNSNLIKIENNSYPSIANQQPLHTTGGLGIPGQTLYGIDFNAWINPIGAGGASALQKCFPTPPPTGPEARLYFAAPSTGNNTSGMMVWYTEPTLSNDEWFWSPPAALTGGPIPGNWDGVEIDSMAFDQRYNANRERHLLISVVKGGKPWPPVDENKPNAGSGSYFIVPVTGEGSSAQFGEPQPLYIELTSSDGDSGDVVLLQTVIGPRSRGTCSTDPTLYKRAETR